MIKKKKEFNIIDNIENSYYKYGFYTNLESDKIPKGINENIITHISRKKNEPDWMLKRRLKSYKIWKKMIPPKWGNFSYKIPDFQNISYYSAIKKNKFLKKEIDNKLLDTFNKLNLKLKKNKKLSKIALDVIMDSVSVTTTFKKVLSEKGIIFCPISKAIKKYPDLIKKYIGKIVPIKDNFYSALNSAVFSDGSFCYIPKNVRCPVELSTYFRINESGIGQFERTLVIADKNSYVSYLEGCTAPQREENQLHAAVVELIALEGAEIKYSTVQNWYPGDKNGIGGVFNFVTKRGLCEKKSKISWTQIETGSAITWKYPSCILKGDDSIGEFYSVAFTKNFQKSDTGTKMIHLGKNTKSTIISKGISAGFSKNSYRGLVNISSNAINSRNFSQCDSLLIGNTCSAHTFPFINVKNNSSKVEHEATTSKIEEDQIFYCNQRGINLEKAISLIVTGFSKNILDRLPMEFAIEARKLLEIKLEGSVG
ncbi:Fe-S cluster assembly protein SufB [Candidatus Karelsulcia muelleri]|uniref:FeS assembly protein SufB n=1 Tax=Candidatus Karelsulcia muelleri PSPU TaxID=1189303 RepID=A0AAD1AZ79_9FLAO|nr:Fe-S cluster assembly protein SufB [Candidatus Karelsulcia muelleri]NJJ98706.1 Fe-S cluster assembly protein SufB [Candidatus Karelsulcia muelleri]BAO66359.1 FeS assembly protein SufB [Candidatus Karelsulcia muelleri PSPU]